LILDPCDDVASLGKLMKRLAGRQTRFVNHKEKRTGSLWEGRYKSSPIETDTYLLACNRYVELNPVKAGMVEQAKDYQWSSYQQKIGTEAMWIDQDSAYLGLSDNEMQRRRGYMDYINGENIESETQMIQKSITTR
jgi:putative transposase